MNEPPVTQSEIDKLTMDVRKLQKETSLLEEKAKRMSQGTEDKLAIYKSQANSASKKKDVALAEISKLETEERALEKMLEQKEKDYSQQKGTKFMKHDDFKMYAATLRGKQTQYKRMRAVIQEIKTETTILLSTEKTLKTKAEEITTLMKAKEIEVGAEGYFVLNFR
jgi:hypothetical protein